MARPATPSETQLLAAWEAAREGVVTFAEDSVTYVNPAAAQMLGLERARVVGRPLLLALRDHRLEALCRTGGEAQTVLRGRHLWARAAQGSLLLWDQTDQQHQLEALQASSRTLAHEFRTPVTGMVSLLEALSDPQALSGEEAREVIAMLRQEAQRLARLVDDLPLTQTPSDARTFVLADLQPRLERFLAHSMAERGSWIEWNLQYMVKANPDAVYQALLNLLDNALKYGPPGQIEVIDGQDEQYTWVEVRDRGSPLPQYEPLFQPGRRGVHAANVRGSGLGLSLVRRLAQGWCGQAYGRSWEGGNAFGLRFAQIVR